MARPLDPLPDPRTPVESVLFDFKERMRVLQASRAASLRQIAAAAGASEETMRKVVSGYQRPTPDAVRRFLVGLGLPEAGVLQELKNFAQEPAAAPAQRDGATLWLPSETGPAIEQRPLRKDPLTAATPAPRRPPRWPSRGVVALAAAAAFVAAALAVSAAQDDHDDPQLVTGRVTCEARSPIVGVFIVAGRGGSGFAGNWKETGPARASFTYVLPHGGGWAVNVGCGGSPQRWGQESRAPSLTEALAADWSCTPPPDGERFGRCRVSGTG